LRAWLSPFAGACCSGQPAPLIRSRYASAGSAPIDRPTSRFV
jgi:hypothetical protein